MSGERTINRGPILDVDPEIEIPVRWGNKKYTRKRPDAPNSPEGSR